MLSPEEIRARTFLVSLRGYDREEVAAFLEQVAGEVELLQQRLDSAEGAAQEVPTAADIVAEAGAGPAEGDGAGTQPFAEIGQETQRILEAAQAAGEELRRRARDDADRELKAARAQAAKVVADAERRRDEVVEAVRALEHAREELAGELRGVGLTLERMLRDLTTEPETTTTVREAMAEAARGDEPADGEPADAGAETADAGPHADDGRHTDSGEQMALAATPGDAEPPAGREPGADGEPERQAPGGAVATAEAGEEAEGAALDEAAGTEVEAERGGRAESPTVDEAAGEVAAGDVPVEDRAEADAEPAGAASAAPTRQQTRPREKIPEPTSHVRRVPSDRSDFRSGWSLPERVPVRARGDALAPSHPKLVRRLKRGLQDLENATLDRLRRNGADGDVDRFLPGDEAVSALRDLASTHVANAYAVGFHAGASAIGEGAGDPPELTRDFAGDLAGEIVEALGREIRDRLGDAAGDGDADLEALTELVDGVFAGVREALVREAGAVALIRAYEWGQHDAWVAAGAERRKWALATEPECGDPRCEENAGSGAVPLGDAFPSGHEVPPVRAGCSCTTIPHLSRT